MPEPRVCPCCGMREPCPDARLAAAEALLREIDLADVEVRYILGSDHYARIDAFLAAGDPTEEKPMSAWMYEHEVECIVCPDCAFTFDAAHTDVSTGGYSCPCCAELALTARLAEAEALLRRGMYCLTSQHKDKQVADDVCVFLAAGDPTEEAE